MDLLNATRKLETKYLITLPSIVLISIKHKVLNVIRRIIYEGVASHIENVIFDMIYVKKRVVSTILIATLEIRVMEHTDTWIWHMVYQNKFVYRLASL